MSMRLWQIVLSTNISRTHPIILFVQCIREDLPIWPEAFSLVDIVGFNFGKNPKHHLFLKYHHRHFAPYEGVTSLAEAN